MRYGSGMGRADGPISKNKMPLPLESAPIRGVSRDLGESAARLAPAVSVRQWVVVFPKRLRYFLDRYADCLKPVAGIAMREVQRATGSRMFQLLPDVWADVEPILELEFDQCREL